MTAERHRNGGESPYVTTAHFARLLAIVLAAGFWLTSNASASDRRDIQLTLKSRQALQKDRDVAELRLTVQVHRGVATIWGPVPSEDMVRRARKLVEQVPGVYEVRTDCYAMTPALYPSTLPDLPQPALPLKQAVVHAVPVSPTSEPWDGIHVVTRHKVEMLPEPDHSTPQKEGRPAIALLAPVAVPVPPTPVRPDLWIQVEKVCNSDPAYRFVKIDVKDGVVKLSGRVARPEQRMALAQEIARLSGVERVSVGDVEIGR